MINDNIRKVGSRYFNKILSRFRPTGKYYCIENGNWFGLYNPTGEFYDVVLKVFNTEDEVKEWLLNV